MSMRVVVAVIGALMLASCTARTSPVSETDTEAPSVAAGATQAPTAPPIGDPGTSFTTQGWTLTHVGQFPDRASVRGWLRDEGMEVPSPDRLDWTASRLDVAGDRLFLAGNIGSSTSGTLAIVELDPATLAPMPVAVLSDLQQFSAVQGIHLIDGRAIAHVGGGDTHGSMVLRPDRVTTRLRPLIERDAMVTTPMRTNDGWKAGAMVAPPSDADTPVSFRSDVAVLTSPDGRTFEVAAQLDHPTSRANSSARFSIHDALFDDDGSGVLVGSYIEQEVGTFDPSAVPMVVPLVVEVSRGGRLTPVYNRRQEERGTVAAAAGLADDPSFSGLRYPDPDDNLNVDQVAWRPAGRGFVTAPINEGQTCDGADSWTERAADGGLVVGWRSRGGSSSEPVVVLGEGSDSTCILPRAFGAMVRTLWFEAVVELPDGQWLAATSDHELWLLAPATGPDTPHTGEGYVAPTDDWEVADPPTRAYARRVLTALYERLFDLQVGARAAQTNGLSRAERDRLEAQVASLYVPELVDHEFERLLEDDFDRLRRSAGRVGISDVSVVASTHHCLEVEATIDFTPAVRTEDGRQPTQYRFALIRQDASSANPTGWVLTSTFSDEGC